MSIDLSHIKTKNPDRLHFGTAGIPLTTNPRNTLNAINRLHELKLDAMELEFVRNVNLNSATAKQ